MRTTKEWSTSISIECLDTSADADRRGRRLHPRLVEADRGLVEDLLTPTRCTVLVSRTRLTLARNSRRSAHRGPRSLAVLTKGVDGDVIGILEASDAEARQNSRLGRARVTAKQIHLNARDMTSFEGGEVNLP